MENPKQSKSGSLEQSTVLEAASKTTNNAKFVNVRYRGGGGHEEKGGPQREQQQPL